MSDLLIAEKSRNALSTLNLIKKGSDLSDIDLILHGSNEFSYPLYAKLLKYPIAFSLTLKAVPIRIAGPLKKMTGFGPSFLDALLIPLHVLLLLSAKTLGVLSNVRLSDDKINDDDLQIIHDDFRKIAGPHFKRDTPFFNWRYKTGPIFNAKVIGIRKGKNILGYVAIKRLNFEGLALGLVIDLQLRRNLTFLERIALRIGILAEHLNHKADVVAILANFKNPVLSQIFRFPFINIPDSYLPHPNPIFVLSKIKDEKLIDELKNTYYTLSDLDYF